MDRKIEGVLHCEMIFCTFKPTSSLPFNEYEMLILFQFHLNQRSSTKNVCVKWYSKESKQYEVKFKFIQVVHKKCLLNSSNVFKWYVLYSSKLFSKLSNGYEKREISYISKNTSHLRPTLVLLRMEREHTSNA